MRTQLPARLHATAPNLSGIDVIRDGRVEPFLHAHPTLSSSSVQWAGVAVEDYSIPACVIRQHEHLENFLQVVLRGSVKYEVLTRGKVLDFRAGPGTTFVVPQGTIDELRWKGPTHRICVAIHPNLLVNALDETAHERTIELTEHWNLTDPNITAVLLPMTTDLDCGSPAGRLYGESLANGLAVYLLTRYAVRRYTVIGYRGGLPGYRLKRVLDYIGDNLAKDLSCCCGGHEPALLCRNVQKQHGVRSSQVCAVTKNRTRKTGTLGHQIEHPRSRAECRLSKFEPFRPHIRQFVGTSPSRFRNQRKT